MSDQTPGCQRTSHRHTAVCTSHIFGVLPLSMCVPLSMSRRFRRQAKMSSRFHRITRAAAICRDAGCCRRRPSRNPTMSIRKCGSSSLRTSCGSSPARTRNCNTATGSSKSACRRCRAARKRSRRSAGAVQPSVSRVAAPPPSRTPAYRQPQPQPGYQQPAMTSRSRRAGADRAGTPGAPPARPAPRRCLRSQPESQCPGRAACARRRPAADAGRRRRSALPADAAPASRSILQYRRRADPAGAAPPPRSARPAQAPR